MGHQIIAEEEANLYYLPTYQHPNFGIYLQSFE